MQNPPVKTFTSAPPAVLQPLVERFWSWEGGPEVKLPTLLPGTGMDLFLHFKAPFAVESSDGSAPLPKAHFSLLRFKSCQLLTSGPVGFIAVRFRTSAPVMLFPGRIAGYLDQFPDASLVLGPLTETLPDRLAKLPGFSARCTCVTRFLVAQLKGISENAFRQGHSAEALYYAGPENRLPHIADAEGCCVRQFERRIQSTCGMPPKAFLRVCRLHHTARKILCSGKPIPPLDAALECGYHDQAHFIHEFRSLTGMTPGSFFKNRTSMSHFYNTQPQNSRILG